MFLKGGLFVYLEPRNDIQTHNSSFLKRIFSVYSVQSANCFSSSLMNSQFAEQDQFLVQRVFKERIYGIAIKR